MGTTSRGRATARRSRAPSSARSPPRRRPAAGRSRPARTSRSTRSRATGPAGPRGTNPGPCTRSDRRGTDDGTRRRTIVSETGDQFAGVSARSTKHSPRVDEELEHEVQGMLKAEHATRAEEWREVEPVAEGDPDLTADPAGTLVGGTPVGMTQDAVVARAGLSRWLTREPFPGTRDDLVEAARDHRAPDAVVAELERLPEGETFERIGDVARALGYPTETRAAREGGARPPRRRPPPRRSPRRPGDGTVESRGTPSPLRAGPAWCRPDHGRRCPRRPVMRAPAGCPIPGA